MNTKQLWETVCDSINGLEKKVYTFNLSIIEDIDCPKWRLSALELFQDELEVAEVYSFTDMINPGENMYSMIIDFHE